MPISTVIIISLLLANLSLTLFMFWIVHDLLSAVKSLQDSEDLLKKSFDINNQLIEKYNKCLDGVYERETTLHDMFTSQSESSEKAYNHICESYKIMYDQYKLITDMQTKLLNCWKGCEERYSQSYELFKHCSDNLKEVSFQLTDLANISTEDEYYLTLQEACDTVCIDCPYGGLKCHDCPVWQLMHRNNISDSDKEKSDSFNDIDEEGDDTVDLDE